MNRYDDLIASRRIYLYIVFILVSLLYGVRVIRFNYGFFQTYFWVTLLDNLHIVFLTLIIFPFFVTGLFRLFIQDDYFFSRRNNWGASETLLLKRILYSWKTFQIPHLLALIEERKSLTPIKTIDEALAYIHRNPVFVLYIDQAVFQDPEIDLIHHFKYNADHINRFDYLLFALSPEEAIAHNEIYKAFKNKRITPFHKVIAESPYNDNIHNLSKAYHAHHPSYRIIEEP